MSEEMKRAFAICFGIWVFYGSLVVDSRKVCELCPNGIVCYNGADPPTSGVCVNSCGRCSNELIGTKCQTCNNTCLGLQSTGQCQQGNDCCGYFPRYTACERGRCCIREGKNCSNRGTCCQGVCLRSTGKCSAALPPTTSSTTSTERPTDSPPGGTGPTATPQNSECQKQMDGLIEQNLELTKLLQSMLEVIATCEKNPVELDIEGFESEEGSLSGESSDAY
eukprot:GHVQ01004147.1.p1 GENE.GHVQ01004147.1~~GHVQ01004147.1.p1  ORF type:complete len:222 (+),score=28.69 GHVQ01004147.1:331-996(+)